MGEKPICVKCKFCRPLGNLIYNCFEENSPITCYVTGERPCHILNYDGRCEQFYPKFQNSSRVEAEELACPECGHIVGCLAPLCDFKSKVTA